MNDDESDTEPRPSPPPVLGTAPSANVGPDSLSADEATVEPATAQPLASARPTPVRQAMAREQEDGEPGSARVFTVDEQVWVAVVSGRSLTGAAGEAGAPLLHVTFHESEPSAAPARELLMVGSSLDPFGDDQLGELLARARPYQEPKPPARPQRKKRRGGRS